MDNINNVKNIQNLKSSVMEKGKIISQIIIFSNGNKKTYHGVITDSIEQGEFTHFDLRDGRRIYINTKNVDCFEIFYADKYVNNNSNNQEMSVDTFDNKIGGNL